MADNDTSQEDRQLEPSARKLQKARAEGQIARSRDLVHLAVLGTALGGFMLHGPAIGQAALELIRHGLRFSRSQAMEPALMPGLLGANASSALYVVLPCVAALAVMAIIGSMVPGGVGFTTKPLMPDFNRLNPATGFARIFSKDNATDLGRLALLAGALVATAVWFVMSHFDQYVALGSSPLLIALEKTRAQLISGTGLLVLLLFFSAMIDVPRQWWRHRVKLRMTHQEAREEMRESEGDPQAKVKIRERQPEPAVEQRARGEPQWG